LNKRFPAVEIAAGQRNATIFVITCIDAGPLGPVGGRHRIGLDALLDALDQVELPGAALDLPDTQRAKSRKE
jgi:hypothetical protein